MNSLESPQNNKLNSRRSPEAVENFSEQKEIAESLIESMIINSKKINEGNNGIIKIVDLESLPKELTGFLKKFTSHTVKEDKIALKMLKIYQKGEGKKEYELQKKAYDIVDAEEDDDKYAKIPEPLLYYEFNIQTEKAKNMLHVDGMDSEQKKIEIILMDYIQGEDLAEYLYRQILIRHKDLKHLAEQAQDIEIKDLQTYVSKALGFARPAGKHRDEGLRIFEKEAVNSQNVNILINFLKKQKDFKFDKSILEKIKNTIDLLHKNNIYHRDLHERNVMKSPLANGKEEIFIIDFGSATESQDKNPGQSEENDNKRLVPDDMIIRRYEPLTRSIEDDINNDRLNTIKELEILKKQILSRPSSNKALNNFTEQLAGANGRAEMQKAINLFTYNIAGSIQNDHYWSTKALAYLEVIKIDKAAAKEFIMEEINHGISPFARQLLTKIIKTIY